MTIDYAFNVYSNGRKNKQCVRATNLKTKGILYFNSMYSAHQYLNININFVKSICKNNSRSATSKKDGDPYTFEYIEKMNYQKIILKYHRKDSEDSQMKKSNKTHQNH